MSFLNLENHKISDRYTVIQEKGQLIATLKTGYRPKRGSEVFVNNIPRDLLVQEIFQLMEKAGDVFQIRVMMDFSGFNRGNGYVTYLSTEAAKKAVIVLDHEEIRPNWPVNVKTSFDNNRLVMKNIPDSIDRHTILAEIGAVIGNGLKDLIMVNKEHQPSSQTIYKSCILRYETHKHALEARKKVWPGIYLWDTAIDINWAVPSELADSRPLFFRNCPENTTKLALFEVLKTIVDLRDVIKLSLNNNGAGCITFCSDKARRKASLVLKDCLIFGRHLQLSLSSLYQAPYAESQEGLLDAALFSEAPLMEDRAPSPQILVDFETLSPNNFFQNKICPFYQPVGDCLSFYPNSPPLPNHDANFTLDLQGDTIKTFESALSIPETLDRMDATFSIPSLHFVHPSFVESSIYRNLKNAFPSIQTICPQPQFTDPGLYNEAMAIQHSIHAIVNFDHPNVTWIFWGPNDEIPNYISAVRILPVVNNCCYEFVLLQVLRT